METVMSKYIRRMISKFPSLVSNWQFHHFFKASHTENKKTRHSDGFLVLKKYGVVTLL